MDLSSILESGVVILGLTEMFKRLFPKKLWKHIGIFTAVFIGTALHIYYYGYSPENAIYGAVLGLSVAGMYKIPARDQLIQGTITETKPKASFR